MSMKSEKSHQLVEPRTDQDENGDFLLLLTLRVPVPFPYGAVLLPDGHTFEHGFVDGDIVRFSGGKEMLTPEEGEDGGTGKLVKIALSRCEKVADIKVAASLRCIIFQPKA